MHGTTKTAPPTPTPGRLAARAPHLARGLSLSALNPGVGGVGSCPAHQTWSWGRQGFVTAHPHLHHWLLREGPWSIGITWELVRLAVQSLGLSPELLNPDLLLNKAPGGGGRTLWSVMRRQGLTPRPLLLSAVGVDGACGAAWRSQDTPGATSSWSPAAFPRWCPPAPLPGTQAGYSEGPQHRTTRHTHRGERKSSDFRRGPVVPLGKHVRGFS